MMGSSKRLLAGIVGIVLLVLAGTAGILISDKNQKNISGGSGTYWSQEEGKILEIDREKGGNHNSENKGRKRNSAGLFQRVCYGRYYPELV